MIEAHQEAGKKVKKEELARVVKKAAKFLNVPLKNIHLSIAIVDDKHIRVLNRRYRKKDKPTDVLSFAYVETQDFASLQGEIIISYDTALRQAKEYHHSVAEEMKLLLAHGILHIAGYNHKTKRERTEMQKAECVIVGEGLCGR